VDVVGDRHTLLGIQLTNLCPPVRSTSTVCICVPPISLRLPTVHTNPRTFLKQRWAPVEHPPWIRPCLLAPPPPLPHFAKPHPSEKELEEDGSANLFEDTLGLQYMAKLLEHYKLLWYWLRFAV